MKLKKREDRRDRTHRKGTRRQKDHLFRYHRFGPIDCSCEMSAWMFDKRPGLQACDCRRRHFGNPKYCWGGPCAGIGMRPAVRERIAGRRAVKAWLDAVDRENVDDQLSETARTCVLRGMWRRYIVRRCDECGSLVDGPDHTWDVYDRQTDKVVFNADTRARAREEAHNLESEHVIAKFNQPS